MAFGISNLVEVRGEQACGIDSLTLNGLAVGVEYRWFVQLDDSFDSPSFVLVDITGMILLAASDASSPLGGGAFPVLSYGGSDILGEVRFTESFPENYYNFSREDNLLSAQLGISGVLKYINYQLSQNSDLVGKIKLARPSEPLPSVQDYGVRVYFGEADWLTTRREKIGPILTHSYRVNVDLVFNKTFPSYSQVFSAEKGISYWDRVMTLLLANNTASGLFRDSLWTTSGTMEQNSDSTVLKGVLTVVIDQVLFNT